MWVFLFQKYGKFWSNSLHHFIKHKHLISEEWWSPNKTKISLTDEGKSNDEYNQSDETCKTVSGPQTNQECKFPSIFRGEKHTTCISGRKRIRPWCSTGLNANGGYVSGMWGYCNTSKCPLPEEA